ncbi:hypothetical protein B0F90DRAFT_1623200 [Multifurca ochricompacta]|uniref:Voltage-gated hydrogen channel 1 n=1 Tax=Multifurca ochricompacta TaxID=376703 RepID=A0AAD4M9X7_9AGAM|nr:hypothetical protein B0F90DRAFT_1623200 [Multifurca ochricompacta]
MSDDEERIPLLQQGEPLSPWRNRISKALESPFVHKLVITLIVIDAACVLADLAYTLLTPDCETSGTPGAPLWLEVLSLISTTITTLFLVEIPLTLWSLGFSFYNPHGHVPHASLHLFDALIIVTTFVLEVVLRGKERELAGLLIVLRLWRLLKLVGGVAVGTGEMDEDTYTELAKVKTELEESRFALARAQDDNQRLRERVAWLESQGFPADQ